MNYSYNRVLLIGNLAADPEMRSTKTGKKVAQFALATNRSKKDANGEFEKTTDYHRVLVWGRPSEVAEKYLKKGRKIFLDGKIINRHYEGNDGKKHYVTEIIANHFQFMSPSPSVKNGKTLPAENNGHGDEESEEDEVLEAAGAVPAEFQPA